MNLSVLIKNLEEIYANNGDLEVFDAHGLAVETPKVQEYERIEKQGNTDVYILDVNTNAQELNYLRVDAEKIEKGKCVVIL